jgi:glycosidase
VKLAIYFAGGLIFGPLLAIWFSFYSDIFHLKLEYEFLNYFPLDDQWELVFVFGLFWLGFYCMQAFYAELQKLLNQPPRLSWWQKEAIYQIYVKTFFDSNGDGVGDLGGVIEKVDYLKSLGVKTVWLSPIYPSGGKDGGYDVTDYKKIDPVYGSMEVFDKLVEKLHAADMHILMDIIPNHTSSEHEWFVKSCESESTANMYRDYYVWYKSEDKLNPPNNWKSVFGGPAWTYVETRQAWYLHQFLPQQPDLNFRCPQVKSEFSEIFKFWLDTKKVDGFRVDALKHLFESNNFKSEPLKSSSIQEKTYDDLDHIYTANQRETFELLAEWRSYCNTLGRLKKSPKCLIVECTYDNVNELRPFYVYDSKATAHFPFNFQLTNIKRESDFKPATLKACINAYERTGKPTQKCWSNWQLGNHDTSRVATRFGAENIDLANALNLLLGGTAVIYNGEELGMQDLPKSLLNFADSKDEFGRRFGPEDYELYSRDYQRTPMQWSTLKNAGFTKAENAWLPVNPNHSQVNVQTQSAQDHSHLKVFRDLMELRKSPSFVYGKLSILLANEQVFAFVRKAFGSPVFLVAMNLSNSQTSVNLLLNSNIAPRGYVAYYARGSQSTSGDFKLLPNGKDLDAEYKVKSPVLTKSVLLKPRDTLILTWPSSD